MISGPPSPRTFGSPSTVKRVAALESFLVEYNDGEGRPNLRIVFKAKGSKDAYILQESVSGSFLTTSANPWFCAALENYLKSNSPKEVESI